MVYERFRSFLERLALTASQRRDGQTKHRGIRRVLNQHYWGIASETANSFLVGSWGKGTSIRPPRDIDLLFVLPDAVYERYQQRPFFSNKQSALLQEIKGVLTRSYPGTRLRGDGQVVLVGFATLSVEVVPAFPARGFLESGQFWICDTHDGGRFKTVDPRAEIRSVRDSNQATNGDTVRLIQMIKRWQEHCNVPLKSFVIEQIAVDFLKTWPHSGKGIVYYDWMVRDFFEFLVGRAGFFGLGSVTMPGMGETAWLGDAWKSRAEMAFLRANKACQFDAEKMPTLAGEEWQKVFGIDMPKYVAQARAVR